MTTLLSICKYGKVDVDFESLVDDSSANSLEASQ